MEWIPFNSNSDTLPPERRFVLVQTSGDEEGAGMPPAVAVGYLRHYSNGPSFVTPGVRQYGKVTHYCDCLGDDFKPPLWAGYARYQKA